MNDSKMIDLEIEKLEKQQEELKKNLDLLKKSKTKIEESEKVKAENLFNKEVNELVAAADLKLYSKLNGLAQLTFNREFDFIYLHEPSEDIVTSSISKLRVEDKKIDQVSKWLDIIVEYADAIQYLLTFDHQDFEFESIDVYIDSSSVQSFFDSDDFHLNISFSDGNTAHVSMIRYVDDNLDKAEISAGEIKYLVESDNPYYGVSISASIEKDCQFDELDKVFDEVAAKLKNHSVRSA